MQVYLVHNKRISRVFDPTKLVDRNMFLNCRIEVSLPSSDDNSTSFRLSDIIFASLEPSHSPRWIHRERPAIRPWRVELRSF